MEPILQVEGLTGGYSKNKPALKGITFEIFPGEMVGMIGLNGAGKSTTLKHILGLMQPYQGEIRLKGRRLQDSPQAYRATYAYVPETPLLYEELTVREHMELTAMAYGLSKSVFESRLEPLLREFQMKERLQVLAGHLSKGMKQKLMLINAFLVDPELYLIDEPFLGLDPLGIRSLLELMVRRKRQGSTILVSSHILSTIEAYCDRMIIIDRGKLAAVGNLQQLRQSIGSETASLEDILYELVGENA